MESTPLPHPHKRSSSLSSFFTSPPPSPVDEEEDEHARPKSPLLKQTAPRPVFDSGEQQIDQDIAELTAQMSDLGQPRGEPDACIFVASLSAQSTDEQLQEDVTEHFGQWGPILSVKVSRDWMNRPFAFVQYEKVRDAHTALKLGQHTMLNRRKLRLEKARVNRTLFVSRWPRELIPSEIQEVLETFGPVEDLNLLRHRGSDVLKGTGFVKYRYRDDAIKAFSGLRHNFKWTVDWASQYPPSPSVSSGYGGRKMSSGELDLHTLFFGNLESSITEEFLLDKVSAFGAVESVQLIKKAESRPAFAFVRFLNDQDAEAALTALDSQEWNGRPVKVRYKERKRFASWSSSSMESGSGVGVGGGLGLHQGSAGLPLFYSPMGGYTMAGIAPPCASTTGGETGALPLAPISPISPETNYSATQQKMAQHPSYMPFPEYALPPPSAISSSGAAAAATTTTPGATPSPAEYLPYPPVSMSHPHLFAPMYDSAGNLLMVMNPLAYPPPPSSM